MFFDSFWRLDTSRRQGPGMKFPSTCAPFKSTRTIFRKLIVGDTAVKLRLELEPGLSMQGLTEIKRELADKNIMKKNDANIKPIMIENIILDENELIEIKHRCT